MTKDEIEQDRLKAREISKRLRNKDRDKATRLARYQKDPERGRRASQKYYYANREALLAKAKERGERNRDALRARGVARRAAMKNRIFALLGSACACCGEAERSFLTLDHKHGGGRIHFMVRGTWGTYLDVLKMENASDHYQILCANCNMAKGRHGVCPHQKQKAAA